VQHRLEEFQHKRVGNETRIEVLLQRLRLLKIVALLVAGGVMLAAIHADASDCALSMQVWSLAGAHIGLTLLECA
jgi:hypothetical protein